MLIDDAVKTFLEKYDREAIVSITELSNERGLKLHGYKMDLFDLKESFNWFEKMLDQWTVYQVRALTEKTNTTPEKVQSDLTELMEQELIKPKDIKVQDFASFVESYLTGLKKISNKITDVKENLLSYKVAPQNIGTLDTFADKFLESVQKEFDKSMDRLLWASGYNAKKKLSSKKIEEKQIIK